MAVSQCDATETSTRARPYDRLCKDESDEPSPEELRAASTSMTGRDFDTTILDAVAHRPWPMPERPWVMTQTWHDLLFAHWAINAADLRTKVPAAFDLDLFDGRAWVAVVPFHMTNVAPRA